MFGSEALEVGIGVTLMLLFVSLICTAAVEGLEIGLKTRAADLERGIRKLLQDPDGTGLAKELYSHPLVYSLFLGDYDPEKLKENSSGEKYMVRAARAHPTSRRPTSLPPSSTSLSGRAEGRPSLCRLQVCAARSLEFRTPIFNGRCSRPSTASKTTWAR